MPHTSQLATHHGQLPAPSGRWRSQPKRMIVMAVVFGAMLLLALLALFTSGVASEENAMSTAPESQPQTASSTSTTTDAAASETSQSTEASSSSTTTSTSATTKVGQDGAVETSVTVNGKDVPVEPNGSVHRTIQDANGTTTVDVSSSSNGESSNSSSSSLNVNVSTNSSSFSSNSSSTFTMGGATENN